MLDYIPGMFPNSRAKAVPSQVGLAVALFAFDKEVLALVHFTPEQAVVLGNQLIAAAGQAIATATAGA